MKRPLCTACLVFVLCMALWMLIFPPAYFSYGDTAGEEVYLVGRVYAKEIKKGEESPVLLIYIEPKQLLCNDQNIPFQDNFICTMKDCEEPPMGSTVMIKGVLTEYEEAVNPGQFDARKYYATLGISAQIKKGELIKTDGRQDVVRERLWQLKNTLGTALDKFLAPKDAAVLKAMLLGEKSSLDEETKALYKEAGIVHVLAISGLHISLLGMGLYHLLKKLRIKVVPAAFLSAAVMLLYGVMVGMPISAVRALFMFLLRLLADCIGRTYDMITALSLCAVLMLAKQPLYLTHSGFLLSFLSVLAVGVCRPAIMPPVEKVPRIADGFLTSAAVMLFTLPVQLYFYFEVSIYASVFNIAVVPLAGVLLVLGMGGTVCFFLLPGMTVLPAFLIRAVCSFYTQGGRLLGQIPGSLWNPGKPKIWQIAVFYLLMALVIGIKKIRYRHRVGLILGAVLLFGIRPGGDLTVTFLDVGQGDCICLELPDGKAWLFDGGSSSVGKVGTYRIEPFLKCRGIQTLDAVFLSHADSDHTGGVEELLLHDKIEIKLLALPAAAQKTDGGGFADIVALAKEKEIPVLWLYAGMEWESGGVNAVCLHPAVDSLWKEDNAGSEVLYISYGDFSLLLTGDVEGEGEKALVDRLRDEQIESVTVLKVAHHGSDGATKEAFLQQTPPRIAVISCGRDNRYGHPHKALLERLLESGCDIRITGGRGAVMFGTDGRVLKQY